MIACDYCDKGVRLMDGYHVYSDPEDVDGTSLIPCPVFRPEEAPLNAYGDPEPVVVVARTVKRHRHRWETFKNTDKVGPPTFEACPCGALKLSLAVKSRRGRNARKRGINIQRERVQGLGGLNLSGNNENLDGLGSMFAYESKSGGVFSDRYWRWLKGIPATGGRVGVLIVTDAPGPGHKARSVVIVDYDDWRDLHGDK
jgi:hypothetical protein